MGTLIIKTKLGVSDEETVHQIAENPYLQFFLGLPRFKEEQPFASSLITHFRKRFSCHILNEVNDKIALAVRVKSRKKDDDDQNEPPASSGESSGNEDVDCKKSGKLILDAICAPADIQQKQGY